MGNYFMIHGSFGSPFGNWFSWLQDFIAIDGNKYMYQISQLELDIKIMKIGVSC